MFCIFLSYTSPNLFHSSSDALELLSPNWILGTYFSFVRFCMFSFDTSKSEKGFFNESLSFAWLLLEKLPKSSNPYTALSLLPFYDYLFTLFVPSSLSDLLLLKKLSLGASFAFWLKKSKLSLFLETTDKFCFWSKPGKD